MRLKKLLMTATVALALIGCGRLPVSPLNGVEWIDLTIISHGEYFIITQGEEYRKRDLLNLDNPALKYDKKWVSVWSKDLDSGTERQINRFELNVANKYTAIGLTEGNGVALCQILDGETSLIEISKILADRTVHNKTILSVESIGDVCVTSNGIPAFNFSGRASILANRNLVAANAGVPPIDHLIAADDTNGLLSLIGHGSTPTSGSLVDILGGNGIWENAFKLSSEEYLLSAFRLENEPLVAIFTSVGEKCAIIFFDQARKRNGEIELPQDWRSKTIICYVNRISQREVIFSFHPLLRDREGGAVLLRSLRRFRIKSDGGAIKLYDIDVKGP